MTDLLILIQYTLIFVMGTALASFLNVVVIRLPQIRQQLSWRGQPITLNYPPSRCMSCETPLKWQDNIPVAGWLKRKGKCRACNEPFSGRYALFELVGGMVFVAPAALMGLALGNLVLGGVAVILLYVPSLLRAVFGLPGRGQRNK